MTAVPQQVMGILNVTPDSFSDGGQFLQADAALNAVARLLQEGADIIDIGGESTRPNAPAVPLQQELDRVMPVIEAIQARFDVPLSVDTSKTEVMQAAIALGVNFINDVNALRAEGAIDAVAKSQVKVCLMHMQGQPSTMQDKPYYDDVVIEVQDFLLQRCQHCEQAGIDKSRIYLDAGFGFGKTLAHNLTLMRELKQLVALGYPVLVGVSRKSMIGQILDAPVDQRLYGGLALASYAWLQGAKIIRTHDVKATVDVLRVLQAVHENSTHW